MNDAAFGKSERLLQGWHVYWGHDADYEDCDMCSEGRAELANARKLLTTMQVIRKTASRDQVMNEPSALLYTIYDMAMDAIAACQCGEKPECLS